MNKFSVRDLINAGVYSILTLLMFYLGGMLGFIPVLMPLVPFAASLLSGIVFMLYSTKINRFGMILIMGIIFSVVFIASGHGIYVGLGGIIASLLAEYIIRKGRYKSLKYARLSYTAFSLFSISMIIPIFISRNSYAQKMIAQGYGREFTDKILSMMPDWSFPIIAILGCVGGFIGCTIGMKILKKHFKKAGMV